MAHKLPDLSYGYDSLEPYIDRKTMKVHHQKHHQAYVDKLNIAIEKYKRLNNINPERLLLNKRLPKQDRTLILNNAGGHINHSFFWKILKKNIAPKGEILEAIKNKFGNFEKFKAEFTEASIKLFGSGWTWLVLNQDKNLEIFSTQNQENPISKKKTALLCLDLWEHAYYLKYQNRRIEYIEAFFNLINWDVVNKNYLDILNKINEK